MMTVAVTDIVLVALRVACLVDSMVYQRDKRLVYKMAQMMGIWWVDWMAEHLVVLMVPKRVDSKADLKAAKMAD